MARSLRIRVPPERSGERLDVLLSQMGSGLSRRAARRLIGQGSVFVDGKRVQVNGRPLQAGAMVTVEQPLGPAPGAGPALGDGARDAPLDVLLDQGDVLIANKASGMATEPTRQAAASLSVALRQHLGLGGNAFLAAVHRLDVETSGVVLFAKSKAVAAALSAAFQGDAVDRRYLALVHGDARFLAHVIDLPLGKIDRTGRRPVDPAGQPCETLITSLGTGSRGQSPKASPCALLLITPRTGRTHQIRAHLAAIGHPIIGDRRYGEPTREPFFGLHALALRAHSGDLAEGGGVVEAFAPLPPAFEDAVLGCGIPAEVLARATARYQSWGPRVTFTAAAEVES